ncbi:MAG: uracil-DNA glycosylase [Patescibacteria group bacterium]|nr:uracil-DNA glycosylase [Patescibacteria group bacterium]
MDRAAEFKQLVEDIKQHHCSLRDGCIQAVPGEGNIDSPVVFIGEGPGKTEDELGRPFVGAAGKLLDEGLAQIDMQREDVYITNVVKCRPPGNRDPLASEVAEHKPFLERELELIQPKLIVLLGRHALQWFLPNEKISSLRGTAKRQGNRIFFAMYHPAAALYDPRLKDTLFSDIKKIPVLLQKIDELQNDASFSPQSQGALF